MKVKKLSEMKGGWFVGNFEPSLIKTNDVEAAVKSYKKGDYEREHFHKIATEITVVISGRVKMFQKIFEQGDMIVVEPFDATDFEALEDTVCAVVKYPGAGHDKYITEDKKND